jgi:hypothetical protein
MLTHKDWVSRGGYKFGLARCRLPIRRTIPGAVDANSVSIDCA